MGFDQNSDLPIVNLHKKTTQVNAWMIAGALVFFLITGAYLVHLKHNPDNAVRGVQQSVEK